MDDAEMTETEARAPMTRDHITSLVGVARDVRDMMDAANARRPSVVRSGGYAEADAIVRLGEEVLRLRVENATARREGAASARERCASAAAAVRVEREERLAALDAEGLSQHDPARMCLVVAITDADRIEAAIRALPLDAPSGQHDDAGGES